MTERTEITGLTALRAVAALCVMMFHLIWFSPSMPSEVALRVLFSSGWFGVDVFFVLSGFVISYVYSSNFRYGDYLVRRFARVYPLYLATTLVAWVVVLVLGTLPFMRVDAVDLLMNMLMLQAWYSGFTGSVNFVSWSVSAEWAAYVFYPILLLVARRLPANWVGVMIPLGILACVGGLDPLGLNGPVNKCLFEFLSGIVLYRFWVRERGFRQDFRYVALASLFLVVTIPTTFGHFGLIYSDYYLAFCAAPLVAYALGKPTCNRWLLLAGRASYSLYLVHGLVYMVLRHLVELGHMAREVGFVLMPLLSVSLALVTYFSVEKPARSWIVGKLPSITPRRTIEEPSLTPTQAE